VVAMAIVDHSSSTALSLRDMLEAQFIKNSLNDQTKLCQTV